MRKILLILLAVVIAGCVHNIGITNFQTGEILQGKFNEINRIVIVVMPDGEVLKGKYSDISNATFSFGTATVYSGSKTATGFGYGFSTGGQGQAYALLKSKTSGLMMEIITTYSDWTGHGFGEARTNDGRTYKVQFPVSGDQVAHFPEKVVGDSFIQSGKKAPLPGDQVGHFPKMVVGDRCVYTYYSKKYGKDTSTHKIIEVVSDGSFVVESKNTKDKTTYLRYYDVKYQLVKLVEKDSGKILKIAIPPIKYLEFPLFVGKKWADKHKVKSVDGNYYDYKSNYSITKYETVVTEAGSLKAFKIIRRNYRLDPNINKTGTEIYWYSPEAKCIVKSKPDWKIGYELISYKLALTEKPPKVKKPKIIIKGERIKIGILEFQGLNKEAKNDELGKVVSEMLTTSFVNSEAFKIIEREQLQKIVNELELSQSGIIDTSEARKIGKIAGATAIVTGSVVKIKDYMRLDARIIDVESGIILTAEKSEGTVDLKSIGMMVDRIVENLVNKFYKEKE